MSKISDDAYSKGKTDATLEGVAKALDLIRGELRAFPCSKRGEAMARIQAHMYYLWALRVVEIGVITAILLKLAF